MFNTKNRKIGVLTVRVAGEKSKQRVKKNYRKLNWQKGICTQATISNIENKNVCDSLDIFSSVCLRLDFTSRRMYRRF